MANAEEKKPVDETQPVTTEIDDTELDQVAGGGDINPQPLPPRWKPKMQ